MMSHHISSITNSNKTLSFFEKKTQSIIKTKYKSCCLSTHNHTNLNLFKKSLMVLCFYACRKYCTGAFLVPSCYYKRNNDKRRRAAATPSKTSSSSSSSSIITITTTMEKVVSENRNANFFSWTSLESCTMGRQRIKKRLIIAGNFTKMEKLYA